MLKQISVVVPIVVLSFAFAISAGSIVIELGEILEEDQDIYIREYPNSSCTFFRSIFGKEYRINETTTCKCVRTNWTQCKTTYVFNTTTTTTSATSSEVPTTNKPSSSLETDETEQREKSNQGYAEFPALAFNYWN